MSTGATASVSQPAPLGAAVPGTHAQRGQPEPIEQIGASPAGEANTLGGTLAGLPGLRTGQGPGTAPDGTAVALGDPMYARAGAHGTPGRPDPRRTAVAPQGTPYGPVPDLAAAPEASTNRRVAEVLEPTPPPDRPRAGWTGADPTRTSTMRRPFLMRAWDKSSADHPTSPKAEMESPIAARPRQYDDLTSGYPTASGRTGTETAGTGPQPNTFRVMPQPWDRLLVNIGGPAADAPPAPANRGRTFR